MDALIRLADFWADFYTIHMIETSLFILIVWAVDRWVTLDTRLRYALWLCALVKAFVPPFYVLTVPAIVRSVPEPIATSAVVQPIFLPQPTINPETFFAHSQELTWTVGAFGIWVCSVVIALGFVLARNWAFHRSFNRAQLVQLPTELWDLVGVIRPKVFVNEKMISPLMLGLFRPRLYLPVGWEAWTMGQLRGVVAHELAHYRSRDLWALVFQVLATVLFGVNPLIWLVNRRLTYLRELRCDEEALKRSGISGIEYGKLLYNLLDKRRYAGLSFLGFNVDRVQMKKRFEYVLNFNPVSKSRLWWQYAIPILIAIAIVPFSIRKADSEIRPAIGEFSLLIEDVETWRGLQKIDVRVTADSKASLNHLKDNEARIKQTIEILFKEIQQGKSSVENLLRLSGIFRDQINLTLGREWVTRVDFGGEVNKKTNMVSDFGLDGARDYDKVDVRPVPISVKSPDYPPEARSRRITGDVEMFFLVNTSGQTEHIRFVSGNLIFESAAVEAIDKTRFRPGFHKGSVVPVKMKMTLSFDMKQDANDTFTNEPKQEGGE